MRAECIVEVMTSEFMIAHVSSPSSYMNLIKLVVFMIT